MKKIIPFLIALSICFIFPPQALADLNDGLLAYYPFNGNANDESGNGHHGTVFGATLTTDRFGNANSAYDFHGMKNYYIDCGSSILHAFTNWTIHAWIYSTGQTEPPYWSQDIYSEIGTNTGDRNLSFHLWEGKLNIYFDTYNIDHQPIVGTSDLRDSKWHHVVATKSGDRVKLYVDTVIEREDTTTRVVDSGHSMRIGHSEEPLENPLKGKIDDVRIYSRALSEDEIRELYGVAFNPKNGHYYELVEVQEPGVNWYEARDAAAALSYNGMTGYLATVTSAQEDNFLANNFPRIKPEYVWLGASDEASEGDWQWITGEPWNYTNWDPGEPNGGTYENCLDYDDGIIQWNDANCGRKYNFYLVEYSLSLLNDLVTFDPDPLTYKFTPNGSSTEELIFSDDFERTNIGGEWITGAFCDSDTITIVDGRVQATENCNYIETVQEFSGNLRIEMDLEKVGSSDHGCWDFGVLLKDLNQYSGIIRFDWGGVDGVAIDNEPGGGCGDDVTIPSGVNKGKAIFTFQDGTVGFLFKNDDGDIIDAGSVYAGNFDSSRIKIHLAAHPDTPRYVDNVKVYSINGACPEDYVGKFSFDATLTNISEKELSNLHVEVDELTNNNLLLTTKGLIGEGEQFMVPRIDDYSDGYLTPDEYVDVPFTVCLQDKKPFRFFVNVLGSSKINLTNSSFAPPNKGLRLTIIFSFYFFEVVKGS